MKKKIITTFLLIFFFFSHSYSTELKISGTKRIDIETIKVYGDIKIQPSYTNEELNQILKNIPFNGKHDNRDISSITHDSRKVKKGTLFIAISGEENDGHDS